MYSQQVLPSSEVTSEAEALRDLEACNDLAFDSLVALGGTLAD